MTDDWIRDYPERYEGGLEALAKELHGQILRHAALVLVTECEAARAFNWDTDRDWRRAAVEAAGKDTDEIVAATRRLSRILLERGRFHADALLEAIFASNVKFSSRDGSEGAIDERLALFLAEFGKSAKKRRGRKPGRIWLQAVRFGPILFPRSLETKRRLPTRHTATALALTYLCRCVTSGTNPAHGDFIAGPVTGAPCWGACEILAGAALSTEARGDVANTAQRLLRENTRTNEKGEKESLEYIGFV
ncbi:MAG: hypothetical protein H6923_01215 [Alphaproteobacteria bacterium]|nr:hypothetical protein [Alphaproteobacteria bacterium]